MLGLEESCEVAGFFLSLMCLMYCMCEKHSLASLLVFCGVGECEVVPEEPACRSLPSTKSLLGVFRALSLTLAITRARSLVGSGVALVDEAWQRCPLTVEGMDCGFLQGEFVRYLPGEALIKRSWEIGLSNRC